MQRQSQALLVRPQHQTQAVLLAVLHRQSTRIGVVEHHLLGRVAQRKAQGLKHGPVPHGIGKLQQINAVNA